MKERIAGISVFANLFLAIGKLVIKEKNRLRESVISAANFLVKTLPIIFGTILFASLIITLVPESFYIEIFKGNAFIDSFIGAIIGSISAGTPITSYIIGGELLNHNISLLAVTAFLVSWVTVGIIQFPAEAFLLGKRFALRRNILSFVFSIIVAILTILIFGVF